MSSPYATSPQGGLVPTPGVPSSPSASTDLAESVAAKSIVKSMGYESQSSGDENSFFDSLKEFWDSPILELVLDFAKNTLTENPSASILSILKHFANADSSDASNPSGPPHKSTENSALTVNQDGSISGLDSSTLNYLNAELAKVYGMDRATAYQEALSNTAYQRAVRDMKNAGLNPAVLFGAGRGSSASGVSYIGRNTGSGSGSGSAEEENFFSDGVYHGIPVLVGLIASIVGRNPKYFPIAQQTTTALMGLVDDFSKLK